MNAGLTEFEKMSDGNLRISLTREGRKELRELLRDADHHDRQQILDDLIAYHLGNGWELLRPEEIGALTSCDLILSEDVERDEDGELTRVGRVYWNRSYQVEDPLDALISKDGLILVGVAD